MIKNNMYAIRLPGRRGWVAGLLLAATVTGCSPEGAGTIDVGKPEAVQAKAGGSEGIAKPKTDKQAKALQIEEEAVKKNPKLR